METEKMKRGGEFNILSTALSLRVGEDGEGAQGRNLSNLRSFDKKRSGKPRLYSYLTTTYKFGGGGGARADSPPPTAT